MSGFVFDPHKILQEMQKLPAGVNWAILAADMAAVCRGQFTPRTDIRFVLDGRGNTILQGRLVQ